MGCLEKLYGPFIKDLSAFALIRVFKTDNSIVKPNKNIIKSM